MRIDVGAYSLHARRTAPARPRHTLVFVHGMAGTHEDWEAIAASLPADERVAVDLPGHGQSELPPETIPPGFDSVVDALVRVADTIQCQRPVWVGYSLGARVLLHLAILRPERVGGLVLESVNPGLEDVPARLERAEEDVSLARVAESLGVAAFLDRWHEKPPFESRRARGDPWSREITKKQRTNSPVGLAWSLRHLGLGSQRPLQSQVAGVRAPTLLVAGGDDLTYAQLARDLAARMPAARAEIVPGSGHAIHLEKPDAFATLVRQFADSLPVSKSFGGA